MKDVFKETTDQWVRSAQAALAKPGDRITETTIRDDFNVYEVLLTRKKTVIARALTADGGAKKGEKYVMPLEFGMFGASPQMGVQLTLYHPPGSDVATVVTAKKPVRVKPAPGESKLAKCKAIFAEDPAADRATVVARFINEAACTPAGAVTYWHLCNKG